MMDSVAERTQQELEQALSADLSQYEGLKQQK